MATSTPSPRPPPEPKGKPEAMPPHCLRVNPCHIPSLSSTQTLTMLPTPESQEILIALPYHFASHHVCLVSYCMLSYHPLAKYGSPAWEVSILLKQPHTGNVGSYCLLWDQQPPSHPLAIL